MLQLGQNPAEEDLIEMMRLVDINGDNEIDFQEFLIMMTMRSGERDTEEELLEAFKLFDLDGSGSISRSELKTLMKNLGQAMTDEEIDAMIDEVDINLDGEISFEEFKSLMVRSNYRAVDLHGFCCLMWLYIAWVIWMVVNGRTDLVVIGFCYYPCYPAFVIDPIQFQPADKKKDDSSR
jgi:calmodulin